MGPLSGVKVIDFGYWIVGPSAAGILADWGADVVKIEPPEGDPLRSFFVDVAGVAADTTRANPPFDLDNRGKRSIALNLTHPDARPIVDELLSDADVFITNLRPKPLRRLGLSYERLSEIHPKLVYCHISGYGLGTSSEDIASYDVGAFYCRSGMASMMMQPESAPPPPGSAMGDHVAGQAAAGAICAALVARSRVGRGQRVALSLFRTGLYAMGFDLSMALRGIRVAPRGRTNPLNPLFNSFRTGDDKWFWLLLLQPDRHWTALCNAMSLESLESDSRFSDIQRRRRAAADLVKILDERFGQEPLSYWDQQFKEHDVWWCPVSDINDIPHDELALQARAFVDVPSADGGVTRMVASPAEFSSTPCPVPTSVPDVGEHTYDVLTEIGLSSEAISQMAERGLFTSEWKTGDSGGDQHEF